MIADLDALKDVLSDIELLEGVAERHPNLELEEALLKLHCQARVLMRAELPRPSRKRKAAK